jgi:uncharacterized protein
VSTAATLLLDTGPWVALHCRDDKHHGWAREQFAKVTGPLLSCEAVVAETCFLLVRGGHDPTKALALVARGVVQMGVSVQGDVTRVHALFERYDNMPASLADTCLVRISELHARCRVFTLDADFHIYRRHGRKVIPLLTPY